MTEQDEKLMDEISHNPIIRKMLREAVYRTKESTRRETLLEAANEVNDLRAKLARARLGAILVRDYLLEEGYEECNAGIEQLDAIIRVADEPRKEAATERVNSPDVSAS